MKGEAERRVREAPSLKPYGFQHSGYIVLCKLTSRPQCLFWDCVPDLGGYPVP